jgi:hypothetical protein
MIMPVFEDEFVYTMMAYDAMCVMPDKVKDVADTNRWGEDLKKRTMFSANYQQRNPRVNTNLSPVLEAGLLHPMRSENFVEVHQFDIRSRQGQLIQKVVEGLTGCKKNLAAFNAGPGGFEAAMSSMGNLAHRLIDVWNPFNLIADEKVAPFAQRFMENVKGRVLDLPFMWGHLGSDDESWMKNTPYGDAMATIIEAERRFEKYFEPIYNAYAVGNGFPACRGTVEDWYNATVNAIARAWLFCCQ